MPITQVAEDASHHPPGVRPIAVDASARASWAVAGPAVSLTVPRRLRRKVTHPATTVSMISDVAQFVNSTTTITLARTTSGARACDVDRLCARRGWVGWSA
ncbi:hypothetical protein FHX52_0270 [Humibacillus xanthopallidus]|uniref:Uncharacterized protein n=1 Tax=Humibacillus xanthopallidus TaxID=412689 RepID=A0A543PSY2_9MICO|nr:hypothetical protein FHX52_0270 [Humibacillus xanthopallidus]